MSRLIFSAVARGAHKFVEQAEEALAKAIDDGALEIIRSTGAVPVEVDE